MGLITVLKNGKLRINRDLSKWRRKQIGKKTVEYYDVHPSALERENEAQIRTHLASRLKEPTEATERLQAKIAIQLQEV